MKTNKKCFVIIAVLALILLVSCGAGSLSLPYHVTAFAEKVNNEIVLNQEKTSGEVLELFCQDVTTPSNELSSSLYEVESEGAMPYGASFKEFKILDSGRPDSESLVITIMGDGFTATQQNDFISAATKSIDYLVGNPNKNNKGFYPFNLFRNVFTVYAIEVISNESGVSKDPDLNNGIVDNYFGSTFYGDDEGKIDRALVIRNWQRVEELKKANTLITVILCNSTHIGGTGGEYAVASLCDRFPDVVKHEIGHTLGKLADEYYEPSDGEFKGREAPNMTQDNNPETVKWKNWLGYRNVDIYKYSTGISPDAEGFNDNANNWYRPHNDCAMRYTISPFCPVCSAALIEQLEERVGKLFNVTQIDDNSLRIDGVNLPISDRFEIPERIYAKDVVQIGESAFANQNHITNIVFPDSLLTIGNNAFANCYNLKSAAGIYVQNIGDEAFANCISLESCFYLNAVEIGSRAFINCNVFNEFRIYKQVTRIGDGAFIGCNNIEFSSYDLNGHFAVEDNIIYNKNKTKIIATGKIPSTVVIPDTVTEIAPSAFEGNINLYTLDFGHSRPQIGECAFADCTNLNEAYFGSYDVPVFYSDSFYNDSFTAFVPYISQGDYAMMFEQNDVDVSVIQTVLSYVSDGQVIHQEEVYYGSILHSLYLPTRDGYSFDGWYRNSSLQGESVSNGVLWEETADTSLYAKWQAVEYKIYFNLHGGTLLGENPLIYTINDSVTFDEPTKLGHTFTGWTIAGQAVDGIDDGTYGDIIVDANWQANVYTISFNVNGGTPSIEPIQVIYGQEFSIDIIPTKENYYLDGWMYNGEKYLDANGGHSRSLDVAENVILEAEWKSKWYYIRIKNDKEIWLKADGKLSKEPNQIYCGTGLDFMNLIDTFKKSSEGFKVGHIFVRFEYNEQEVKWTSVPDIGTNGDTIIIEPIWDPEIHSIHFHTQGGKDPQTITEQYGATVDLPEPARKGYILKGWSTDENGDNMVFWNTMPDLTPNDQSNGSCDLYAQYKVIEFKIFYELDGGVNSAKNPKVFSLESDSSLHDPTKKGNTFDGWYLDSNKTIKVVKIEDIVKNTDDIVRRKTIYAKWVPNKYTIILDRQGGTSGATNVTATYSSQLPYASAPTRVGYDFQGYYSLTGGKGIRYYDSNMNGIETWTIDGGGTLYAYWTKTPYTITFDNGDDTLIKTFTAVAYYNEQMPDFRYYAPKREGYAFEGYYSLPNGNGTKYYSMKLDNEQQSADIYGCNEYIIETLQPIGTWNQYNNATLYANWVLLECDYDYENVWLAHETISTVQIHLMHGEDKTVTAKTISGYTFLYFAWGGHQYNKEQTTVTFENVKLYRSIDGKIRPEDHIIAVYDKQCVAEGTLITLADGTQVPVETLTGDEMLLVWNMQTGMYDSSRILFIDQDPAQIYKVINLGFSDGTTVKVISEHGFWDYDLNQYVYLRQDAAKYIGHWFNKGDTRVQLTNVEVRDEYTVAYSPVTYGHLCYYVNGMLSMPGGIEGLFNIFDVDADTMTVNAEAMAQDIETYGLFTYEEFAEILPVSQDVFNAFNGQYLKIAIGKGLISVERLEDLVNRYSSYFDGITIM